MICILSGETSSGTGNTVLPLITSSRVCRPLVEAAIRRNLTFITRFSHPGFELTVHTPKRPLRTYRPGHPSYRRHVQKRQEFAEGMRNAQICVFDASMEKKAIRKYAQAFLSGCVVAADCELKQYCSRLVLDTDFVCTGAVPTEHEAAFRDFMIVLRPKAHIEEINTIIYEALQDPLELQRKALAAFLYAREFLTNTRKVDRMIDDAEAYKQVSPYHIFPQRIE
jgi:hypothetical protein